MLGRNFTVTNMQQDFCWEVLDSRRYCVVHRGPQYSPREDLDNSVVSCSITVLWCTGTVIFMHVHCDHTFHIAKANYMNQVQHTCNCLLVFIPILLNGWLLGLKKKRHQTSQYISNIISQQHFDKSKYFSWWDIHTRGPWSLTHCFMMVVSIYPWRRSHQ